MSQTKHENLNSAVSLVERDLPGYPGMAVRAALVSGSRHRVVVDTLLGPADMDAFRGAGLVVYTHADWDHCWGTAAFPGAPVLGHLKSRERLLDAREAENLARMRERHPDDFAGAAIIPPDVAFGDRLNVDAGGVTLRLHHLPGHTSDSLLIHIPEHDLILAGDTAEDPLPSLNEPGGARAWARQLRQWSRAGVRQVVPSHGRSSGADLLVRNATYLEELLGRVGQALSEGHSLDEIRTRLPVEAFLPDADRQPPYYHSTHRHNVEAIVSEVVSER